MKASIGTWGKYMMMRKSSHVIWRGEESRLQRRGCTYSGDRQ